MLKAVGRIRIFYEETTDIKNVIDLTFAQTRGSQSSAMFAANNFRFDFLTGLSKPFPNISGCFYRDLLSDHGMEQRLERVPARFEVPFGIGFNDFCHDGICLGKLFFRLLPPFGLTGLLCHRH